MKPVGLRMTRREASSVSAERRWESPLSTAWSSRARAESSACLSSETSGATSSAAFEGVAARWSATKSEMVSSG